MRGWTCGLMAAVVAVAMVGFARPAHAEDAAAMLQKGIYQEETAGNIDGAIEVYKKIIDLDNANQATVAEARYRLAECYLKKGRKGEAVAAFKAVVTQYDGQFAIADKAKERLATLSPGVGAPRIVGTNPKAFANDVSASLGKITVTFDQPMMDGSWSWTGGGETYPKVVDKISYDKTKTTCTLPVKLEPGKAYWVGINSKSHKNFKNNARVPAPWYVIVFATRGADGKPTEIPADMAARARRLNDAVTLASAPNATGAASQSSTEPTEEQQLASESDSADGWRLWREGKLADAEAKFKSAVEANPKNTAAWNGLGWAQLNQGKPMNAKKAFQKCVELDPKASASWNGLGYIAKGEGKTDEAIGYWKKAVEASPSATASLSGLADTYMELKKPAEAAKYYRMWLEQESDNEDARAGLAKAQKAQGKTPSLPVESTEKSDEVAAPAVAEKEDVKETEPAAEVSGDKKQESVRANAAGWRLWMQKKYPDAETEFKKALAADPGNVAAWNGIGWAQFNQGKALNATKSFKKCVELDPNVSGAWNGLGYISKNAGKTDDAITYWKKAIEVEPKATASLAGLARTYMELKKYDEAVKYYEMLVKADPRDAKAKSELQKAKRAAGK